MNGEPERPRGSAGDGAGAAAPEPGGLVSAVATGAPATVLREGRYEVRFARSAREVEAALRLRYEVFNLELDEGLASSHLSGRDEDDFDEGCHHLLVIDRPSGAVIGTYRLQTGEMAAAHRGFYSDGEYVLEGLGRQVLDDAVEIGRACVAREHRRQKVLFALWKGLAVYVTAFAKRHLFGCCSLTSQDPAEGLAVMRWLERHGHVAAERRTAVRAAHRCVAPEPDEAAVAAVRLPALFGTYLRFGAEVVSDPALDRDFKTIDYLVLMDVGALPERTRAMFFDR